MKAYRHFPQRGDVIMANDRTAAGQNPQGRIVFVDRECEEVHVQWDGRVVKSVINCFEWNGRTVRNHHYEIDGIWYPSVIDMELPEMISPGGDWDSYSFDELEGNWSSSDGGKGAWYI